MDKKQENNKISYNEYILSDEWAKKVQEAKRRAAYRCQICNRHEDEVILDGHHRTYERLGQEWIEDITILCRDCHELFERQKRLAKYGLRPHTAGPKNKTSEYQEISTGFEDLDRLLGGFKASSLITIVGAPRVGKTSLLINIASIAITNGIQTVFFGLQSSFNDLTARLMSVLTSIEHNRLRYGPVYEEDFEKIKEITELLTSKEAFFIETDPTFTVTQLREKCVDLCTIKPINLVLVDGLELLNETFQGQAPKLWVILRSLKNLARELSIPIVVTWPTNYDRTRIDLFNVHPSIQKLADVIISVYRDELYNPVTTSRPGLAELSVVKNRYGPNGTVDLRFSKETGKFSNLQTDCLDATESKIPDIYSLDDEMVF